MTVADVFETLDYGPAPESAALAEAWLAERGAKFGLFIGGAWVPPAQAAWFDSTNPATSRKLAAIAQAAARRAQPAWAKLGGHGRARFLYALARLVQKHSRLLAVLETLDNGKPIRETRDIDIPLVARHFYHHAGWAQLFETQFAGQEPHGVVGQIVPWNFPLLMLAWKIAPSLAAGNTVVLKPAEFTSLTALCFAELCQEAGLPSGVVNILTGDGATGALIVDHGGIDKLAFTGSTEVGRIIRRATAGSGKALTLELGGKSPFMVFDDADLDSAIEGVVDAIWFNQGQVCCAGSRLLVQESVAEPFLAKLRARMETLRVGDPLDKSVDIGAIVAPIQLQRIEQLVAQGVEEGAELWQPTWAKPAEGCFYPPTLFTNVQPAATIAREEIFGPVLVTMTFRTPDEAVALANNTPYGLAASLWSETLSLALDVAPKLKCGVVWVSSMPPAASAATGNPASAGRAGARAWRPTSGPSGGGTCRPTRTSPDRPDRPSPPPAKGSTGPPSSTSAASRPGPIPATAGRWSRPRARSWPKWATATARTSATRSKPPARPKAGAAPRRTYGPRSFTIWRRIWTCAARSSPSACGP
jgi:aldehyde dehydrogenase (NAD+)